MQQTKSTVKTIGIDARMYGYAQTGIGTYIRHLINDIVESDQENNYVIFLSEEEFDNFLIDNPRVKKVKTNIKWYSLKEQLLFPWIIYKEKIDLMHFPHFNTPILYLKKNIVTIHDVIPLFFPGRKKHIFFKNLCFKLVFFLSVQKANKIIAVSQATKNDIIKYFKGQPEKIHVIYESADDQFAPITDQQIIENIKQKYKLQKPFLFYTGLWRSHKNLSGLIKALKILKDQNQLNFQLVLGGKEEPQYPETRTLWQQLKLDDDIISVGFIPQNELPIFYNAAYAFIVPSFYEGFGLIGLEAIKCGTPVLSSNATSLPEILGPAALYFNPYDPNDIAQKINLVFQDKKLYNELKVQGFKQIQKYSWKLMSQQTAQLYKQTLQ